MSESHWHSGPGCVLLQSRSRLRYVLVWFRFLCCDMLLTLRCWVLFRDAATKSAHERASDLYAERLAAVRLPRTDQGHEQRTKVRFARS